VDHTDFFKWLLKLIHSFMLEAGLRVTSRSHGSGCPDLIQVLRYLKMDNARKATDTQVLDDVYISPG